MITSRLPHIGTTIFTVMSALAVRHQAVNLGQGFPDFDCDPALVDAATRAMRAGHNQYPPMAGWSRLREAIADKIASIYGHRYDPETEVTVTAGATQALLTAILAVIHPGDEAIVIEPAYDSYVPAILLAGGRPVLVQMQAPTESESRFSIPWEQVRNAVTPRTRLILINTPHNPTGMTLHEDDMRALEDLVTHHALYVLSDEVYEHMVFDGRRHESVSRYPALAQRSIVVSSFGKTFHVTGWKVGYAAAPRALSDEFRKVHQFNVFTVNTPMQAALAEYLGDPSRYLGLPAFYQAKRDFFREGLASTRFRMLPAEGTYFQTVDFRAVRKDLSDFDFCRWLVSEIGVAAIPLSAFHESPRESNSGSPGKSSSGAQRNGRLIRFCYAKKVETLTRALDRLTAI